MSPGPLAIISNAVWPAAGRKDSYGYIKPADRHDARVIAFRQEPGMTTGLQTLSDAEKRADFTKPEDMFNRTIEGVVQQLFMGLYFEGTREGQGMRVVNDFYAGTDWEVDRHVEAKAREMAGDYFKHLIKEVNNRHQMDSKKPAGTKEGDRAIMKKSGCITR